MRRLRSKLNWVIHDRVIYKLKGILEGRGRYVVANPD